MILMQLSVEGQDGRRICIDVDIDPHSAYPQSLGERVHRAILLLLPQAVPSDPPRIHLVN
jgi:hypothetical protein